MIVDRFSWSIAIRSLLDSRRLTVLTVGVVGVSVVLVIFITALITGLQARLIEDVTGAIPHVTVEPEERRPAAIWDRPRTDDKEEIFIGERTGYTQQKQKIEDWSTWRERVEERADQAEVVTPTVRDQGFILRGQTREAAQIYGVRPAEYNEFVDIESDLMQGRFENLAAGEVAIGRLLAEELRIEVGDRVQVSPPEGQSVSMSVGGVFDTGFGQLDRATVLMPLGDAQSLFGLGSAVTSIDLQIADVFEADDLARRLESQVPYEVESWTEDNEQLLSALEAQGNSSTLIVVFAAIAAAFAVASILVVLVSNKLQEIGILKAMGASRRQIRRIFAIQGTALCFVGSVVGTILGAALVWGLGTVESPTETGRMQPLFPFDLTVTIVLGAILVASLIGLLASLIPALQAARVEPIDVIRGA